MNDLFDDNFQKRKQRDAPLAERIRPNDFNEFFGQEEILHKNSPFKKTILNDKLSSVIFWGPPGSGKTTLAKIIAGKTKSYFKEFSAVTSGIPELRKVIEEIKERKKISDRKTIIFIDEIHRFNKAQQSAFLPHVEDGTIILIGATTENPSFGVISPLLSRSTVYILKPLSVENIVKILLVAIKDKERGLGNFNLEIEKEALFKIARYSDGDARVALNSLDFAFKSGLKEITEKNISKILEIHALRYDKKGDEHYNLISALIKSMRDSDPDGALYWLSRMIISGEDPRFIARRMIIFASEDIGNRDPMALIVANSVKDAILYVGMPEAQINLAQGVTYLSTAPKSNASYKALLEAINDAKKGSFGVPLHLRNASTFLTKELGYGKNYKYAHDYNEKTKQKHFPKEIGDKKYYFPGKK